MNRDPSPPISASKHFSSLQISPLQSSSLQPQQQVSPLHQQQVSEGGVASALIRRIDRLLQAGAFAAAPPMQVRVGNPPPYGSCQCPSCVGGYAPQPNSFYPCSCSACSTTDVFQQCQCTECRGYGGLSSGLTQFNEATVNSASAPSPGSHPSVIRSEDNAPDPRPVVEALPNVGILPSPQQQRRQDRDAIRAPTRTKSIVQDNVLQQPAGPTASKGHDGTIPNRSTQDSRRRGNRPRTSDNVGDVSLYTAPKVASVDASNCHTGVPHSESNERHGNASPQQHHLDQRQQDRDSLDEHKDERSKSIQGSVLHRGSATVTRSDNIDAGTHVGHAVPSQSPAARASVPPVRAQQDCIRTREDRFVMAQYQAIGDYGGRQSGGQEQHPARSGRPAGEARQYRIYDSVHWRPPNSSQPAADRLPHATLLNPPHPKKASTTSEAPPHPKKPKHHIPLQAHFRNVIFATSKSLDKVSQLPLHVPEVPLMDMTQLDKLALGTNQELAERYAALIRFTRDASLYQPLNQLPKSEVTLSSVDQKDIDDMIASGKFVQIKRKRVCGPPATQFAVVEEAKERRRAITWPAEVNLLFRDQLVSKVPDCLSMAKFSAEYVYARIFDFKAGFYQIPLARSVSAYFHFAQRSTGKSYALTAVPMGVTWAPDLMHTITTVLADLPQEWEVLVQVFIDNVRFLAKTKDRVDAAAQHFLDRCRMVGATVREEPADIFLGAEYDYQKNMLRVKPSAVEKLHNAKKALEKESITIGALRELLSRCVYSSRVLRVPLAHHYLPLKFCRRRLATYGDSNEHVVSIWPTVRPAWKLWIDQLTKNSWTRHPHHETDPEFIIFTDASKMGYGAIFVGPSTLQELSGRWTTTEAQQHINVLEAKALQKAMQRWAPMVSGSLAILVDNTSMAGAVRRGLSPSYDLNKEIAEILKQLPQTVAVRVGVLASAENPADAPSRGLPVASGAVSVAVAQVGRWLASGGKCPPAG